MPDSPRPPEPADRALQNFADEIAAMFTTSGEQREQATRRIVTVLRAAVANDRQHRVPPPTPEPEPPVTAAEEWVEWCSAMCERSERSCLEAPYHCRLLKGHGGDHREGPVSWLAGPVSGEPEGEKPRRFQPCPRCGYKFMCNCPPENLEEAEIKGALQPEGWTKRMHDAEAGLRAAESAVAAERESNAIACRQLGAAESKLESLSKKHELLRAAVNSSADDCTEACDSYAHREDCKTHDPAAWIMALQSKLESLTKESRFFREALWLGHGHDGLYGDDGEMQCGRVNQHGDVPGPMDFKRDSPERICRAVFGAARQERKKLEEALRRAMGHLDCWGDEVCRDGNRCPPCLVHADAVEVLAALRVPLSCAPANEACSRGSDGCEIKGPHSMCGTVIR